MELMELIVFFLHEEVLPDFREITRWAKLESAV